MLEEYAELPKEIFHPPAEVHQHSEYLRHGYNFRFLHTLVVQPCLGHHVSSKPHEGVEFLGYGDRLLAVGIRNNNKRKESTRIREVCSSCHFFLAKQRYFYLARRVSKFRTNLSNTKVN